MVGLVDFSDLSDPIKSRWQKVTGEDTKWKYYLVMFISTLSMEIYGCCLSPENSSAT